ncbi:MAG: hypothetical protein JWN76_3669 [Chitinophagaceae bacterium]|nr:hypothetical protein [Chitinophagaceae bacterium]
MPVKNSVKVASVKEIKDELSNAPVKDLLALCLRLVKFKKENKELISYLLFEAHDLQGYIQSVKNEMDQQFAEINKSNLYLSKKSLRKILRITNKYIRHTGSCEVEAELLIYYCSNIKKSGIAISKSTALKNLYAAQLKKIQAALSNLHEDLQYEYNKVLDKL